MKIALCLISALSLTVISSNALAYERPTTLPSERPTPTNARVWTKNAIYTKGDTVRYLGRVWVAKWWTQGDRPNKDKKSGPWKTIHFNGHKPTNKLPRYQANVKYRAGERVRGWDNRTYRCKAWPATPWCQLKAYAPGTSQHWREAWNRL